MVDFVLAAGRHFVMLWRVMIAVRVKHDLTPIGYIMYCGVH